MVGVRDSTCERVNTKEFRSMDPSILRLHENEHRVMKALFEKWLNSRYPRRLSLKKWYQLKIILKSKDAKKEE
ncbi:hypothetical protein PV327_010214, partial [Microctonus hyperodae]